MNKIPQYNQLSNSQVDKICIYQNMESGRHSSIYISLKINKNSGFHVRKYLKQQYLKVVQILFSLVILHSAKKRIYVYDHTA